MRLILLLIPACVVAACEKAVTIVAPESRPTTPVTEIKVQFSKHFKPGTFTAKLDGNDITPLFAPTPAPGGNSTAQLPGLECGFEGGQPPPASPPPPPPLSVGKDTNAQSGGPISSGGTVSQPSPPQTTTASQSTAPPVPAGLPVFWHKIVVDGDCGIGRACEGDDRLFLPLHLVGVPIKQPLVLNTPKLLQVEVWPPASVPIGVKIKPEVGARPRVNLGAGPDVPVSTSVPAGARSPYINIVGILQPTTYVLRLCAPGTQRGAISGPITAR